MSFIQDIYHKIFLGQLKFMNVKNSSDTDLRNLALDDEDNLVIGNSPGTTLPSGGTNTTFLRGDNTWATPTNTTYSIITQANIENTTSTTSGLTTGQREYQAYVSYNKGGVATFTGDNTLESFTIPHGLGVVPRFHSCTRNSDSGDTPTLFSTMADATNITVTFATAPMTGVIIGINWHASK